MIRRALAIALSLVAVGASGGCTIYSVHAQDGTDAMPVQLRSSSDDDRPAVGIAASAATTRPAGGFNPLATVGGARTRVSEWLSLDEFKAAARDLDSPVADLRRKAIEQVVARTYGRREPYLEVYRTTAQFDADGLVRATAVRAINRARDASAGAILVAALGDGEPRVRLEAAKALCNLPTPAAEFPLRKLTQSAEEGIDARIAATDALRHYPSLDARRTLVSQLNSNNFALAWQSRRSLFLQTDADYRYDESAWLNYLTTATR